jgi:hypothetical protein
MVEQRRLCITVYVHYHSCSDLSLSVFRVDNKVRACYFLNLRSYIISWKNSHENYLGYAFSSGFYIIRSSFFSNLHFLLLLTLGCIMLTSGAPIEQYTPPFPLTKNHPESSCILPYTTHYKFLTLYLGLRLHFFAAVIVSIKLRSITF